MEYKGFLVSTDGYMNALVSFSDHKLGSCAFLCMICCEVWLMWSPKCTDLTTILMLPSDGICHSVLIRLGLIHGVMCSCPKVVM